MKLKKEKSGADHSQINLNMHGAPGFIKQRIKSEQELQLVLLSVTSRRHSECLNCFFFSNVNAK